MPELKYFIVGDLLANVVTGIVTALFCHWMIGTQWSMFVAMLVAMPVGMILGMLLALLVFVRFYGAMEVMVPTMVTGMVAGMLVGMRAAMAELMLADAILYGALCGLATIGLCWAANGYLRGEYEA